MGPKAIVFVPESVEDEGGLFARRGVAHAERRGYTFAAVLRSLEAVRREARRLAREGTELVVVSARKEHWPSRQKTAEIRHEVVGDETCELIPFLRDGEVVSRRPAGGGGGSIVNEVLAYRSGYADGYVDSTTLRPSKHRNGPI